MLDYKPLADPFDVQFEKDGKQFRAKIVYAKSATSCANFFNVEILKPEGMEPFCLKEKPVRHEDSDSMIWVDEDDKQSLFYQVIGEEIAAQLKSRLGVVLLDSSISDDEEEDYQ